MSKRKAMPALGTLADFQAGDWVEAETPMGWRTCRIRFFLGKENVDAYVRWDDEGERVRLPGTTPAKKAQPPEGTVMTSEATGTDEIDPLLRR